MGEGWVLGGLPLSIYVLPWGSQNLCETCQSLTFAVVTSQGQCTIPARRCPVTSSRAAYSEIFEITLYDKSKLLMNHPLSTALVDHLTNAWSKLGKIFSVRKGSE